MNKFRIKYYYQSAFSKGYANDWDNIYYETVQLNLPKNSDQMKICDLWQNNNRIDRRVSFVSAELVN